MIILLNWGWLQDLIVRDGLNEEDKSGEVKLNTLNGRIGKGKVTYQL